MNGPSPMYKLKPVYQLPEEIELPTCMYKLRNPATLISTEMPSESKGTTLLADLQDKKPLPEVSVLEARWDTILKQLEDLKNQMSMIRETINSKASTLSQPGSQLSSLMAIQGAVVNANPSNPPFSLLLLRHLLKDSFQLVFSCHVHSTVSSLPDTLKLFENNNECNSDNHLKLLLIWKENVSDTEFIINPVKQTPILGEVNILRHFGRLGLKLLGYPSNDLLQTIHIDSVLDLCHRLTHVQTSKEKVSIFKNLNAKLGRNSYFGGDDININDISAWSAIKRINANITQDLTQNMAKWFLRVDALVN